MSLQNNNNSENVVTIKRVIATTIGAALIIGHIGLSPAIADEDHIITEIADSQPDECFIDFGDNEPLVNGECEEGTPKTNEAYVWGLTQSNGKLYFGTGANIHCLVTGTYLGSTSSTLRDLGGVDDYVCELGDGADSPLPDVFKDWRPPSIYSQDISSGKLTKLNSQMDVASQQRAATTVGIRAAGAVGNLVYLGGPSLTGGINLFVFNSSTGAFVESATIDGYRNIRTLKPYQGSMVAGVAKVGGSGAALVFSDSQNPLSFNESFVTTAGEIAEFEFYEDRMYFGTWPTSTATVATVASTDLITDMDDFGSEGSGEIIWQASDYEPDEAIVHTYGVGAMKFFNGKLYFGTMHVPLTSLNAVLDKYEELELSLEDEDYLAAFLGSLRSTALFEYDPDSPMGWDDSSFQNNPNLVFGDPALPTFDYSEQFVIFEYTSTGEFLPDLALSGFNNPFNNYMWAMSEYDDELYIGTMDWSYLLIPVFGEFVNETSEENPLLGPEFFNPVEFLGQILQTITSNLLTEEELSGNVSDTALENFGFFLYEVVQGFLLALQSTGNLDGTSVASTVDQLIDDIDELYTLADDGIDNETYDQALALAVSINNDLAELITFFESDVLSAIDFLEPLSYGADVMALNAEGQIRMVSNDGLGNYLNYGIRTMTTAPGEGLFLGTANPMNLQVEGGWELYRLSERVASPFSAPVPFAGPVVTTVAEGPANQTVSVEGRNLHLVESIEVDGIEVSVTAEEDRLSFTIPEELSAGDYSITFHHQSGSMLKENSLRVLSRVISAEESGIQGWTKRISETQAKIYVKNPQGQGKIQFFVDGEEIAWIRAEDSSDPKLRTITEGPMAGTSYLVRTVDLQPGKNALEIYQDGERIWRAAYTRQ